MINVGVHMILLRGTIVNRTYGTDKKPIYFPILTNNIWSYLLCSPVILTAQILVASTVVVVVIEPAYLPFNEIDVLRDLYQYHYKRYSSNPADRYYYYYYYYHYCRSCMCIDRTAPHPVT